MEQRIKSCFGPVFKGVSGTDYSDDLVEEYEMVAHCKPGPSGEETDFIVEKKPVLIERYHLNKVIAERAKGNDLKSIIARCERTDDYSELAIRKGVYGDGFKHPRNLSDACQEGVRTAQFLDSLTDEQKKEYIRLAKLPKSELDAYLASLDEKKKQPEEVVKGGVEDGK